MNKLFKEKFIKRIIIAFVITLVIMIIVAITGKSFIEQGISSIITPIQKPISSFTNFISEKIFNYQTKKEVILENERLVLENAGLRNQLVDLENYKQENERLKDYLQIKNTNPNLLFIEAEVIGRDFDDKFYSFTIDKGRINGVKEGNIVITPEGVVGIVSTCNPSSAKVKTILDTTVSIAAMDIFERETGITEGSISLAEKGCFSLSYISRDTQIKENDIIVTSGTGDIYPKKLILGRVKEIEADKNGLSAYALVEPYFDIRNVNDVIVITDFTN